MNKKKIIIGAAVALVAALALLIGSVTAYLNDRETQTDRITLSDNLRIELLQPAWKAGSERNVQPRQVIPKDPRVANRSDFDVFAFIEVVVPYYDDLVVQDYTGRTVNADRKGGALYNYDVKPGWEAVEEPALTRLPEGGTGVATVYAWMRDGVLTPLKSGETTDALFEALTVANYVNDRVEGAQTVTVNAYGIDAAVTRDADASAPRTPQTIWALLKNTYPEATAAPSATGVPQG